MLKKTTFNALKKLTPQKRSELSRSDIGPSLISLLTPSQMADLFPDYYKRALPDVSGFREAISRKSRQQQELFEQSVSEKLGIDPKTGRTKGGWLEKMDEEYRPKVTSGSLSQNQREAYKAARAEGLSDKAAKILVANLSGENLKSPGNVYSDPSSRNPNQKAHGIAAWDDFRSNRIKQNFGKSPEEMSVAEQTKAAIWEMKTYYKKSWTDLNDENLSDGQRMTSVVSDFERPKDVSGSVSNRMGYLGGLRVDKEEDVTKSSDVSRSSAATGGHYGESDQCVALSKHFAPQVGRAKEWRVNFNPGGIKPGTVIATMSYNDGTGGKMAKDMPDGKSHYHTGIALTAPDSNGNVLILDQSSGRGSAVHMININSYNGEQWGIVEGGQPTERTMQAVEIGKKLADKSQLAMIEGNAATVSSKQAAPPPPGPVPDRDAPEQPSRDPSRDPPVQDPKGVKKEDLTATVQQREQKGQETTESAKPPTPPKKERTFILSKESFLSEIEKKHPEAAMFGYTRDYNWKETIKGFQESGVPFKVTKQGIEITVDPSDPRYTNAVEEMKSQGLDQSVFLSQKKEEEQKPSEVKTEVKTEKKAPEAPKPPITSTEKSAQAEEPPPQAFAGGGRTKAKGPLSFVPIPPRRGDDTMVTDSTGKQFTMNKKETISIDKNSDTATISHREDLGVVAKKFESGTRGVETVSSGMKSRGRRDPGGVSYGAHQLSSRTPRAKVQTGGTMGVFLRSEEGQPYRDRFAGLKPGTPQFSEVYKEIAKEDPKGFEKAQKSFITRTHYDPVYEKAKKMGYKVDDPKVQETLYSISVQHGPGGASKMLRRAADSVSGSAERQVNAIFDVRTSRFREFAKGRYNEERRNTLAFKPSEEPTKTQYAQDTQVKPGFTPQAPGTETTSKSESQLPTQKLAAEAVKPRTNFEKVKDEVFGQTPAAASEIKPTSTTPSEKIGATTVSPTQKVETVPQAAPNFMKGETRSIVEKVDKMQENIGQPTQNPPNQTRDVPLNNNPQFINNTLNQRDVPYLNPSMERAMQRSVAGTETDPMHGHYSWGNN